jgi:formylglycine-generating enzyme required for sulfatase activity
VLSGVFICYRREDSAAFAGRIYDRLITRLGRENVFFDVDNIAPGLDFVDVISERIGKCDALVAVIGRNWITSVDRCNRRRLEDPGDVVRLEIEAALARGIRIIPVLVDGAAMPRCEDLPDSLGKLTRRQGIEISHIRFDSDVERLMRALSMLGEELLQRAAVREDSEKHEAAQQAEPTPLPAEAPVAQTSKETNAATATSTAVAEASEGAVTVRTSAAVARPSARWRRPFLLAVVSAAILAATLLSAKFWSRRGDWPLLRSSDRQTALPESASGPAPPQSPTLPSTSRPTSSSTPPKPDPSRLIGAHALTFHEERALRAKDVFTECVECPEMVVVPVGSFVMGSSKNEIESGYGAANEGPQHPVAISRRFALARYEVTRDQFQAFSEASQYPIDTRCHTLEKAIPQERADRSFRDPGFEQTGLHPVVCVNWLDATAYAKWLSRKTGGTYRLPTEAEYEYAARAGGTSRYGFTDDATDLCKFANGADQSAKWAALLGEFDYPNCSDGWAHTAPVGWFPANDFGLYDLLGNVWEWTTDCYRGNYALASSGDSVPSQGLCVARTVRGGSWSSPSSSLRPAVRAKAIINNRYDDLGFRVVRELEP